MSNKGNEEGKSYDKNGSTTKQYTARMSAESIVPVDEQAATEPPTPKSGEQAICPVCNIPATSLSPSPCPGCGKHFCIICRAQTKDDRCYMCYTAIPERYGEKEHPVNKKACSARKLAGVPSGKPGEESADASPLPPLSELEFGELKFVPPREKGFRRLDFDEGRRYQESMLQTDFGETDTKKIARLASFFRKKLPGEQRDGESVVDTVIRLLGHYTHE